MSHERDFVLFNAQITMVMKDAKHGVWDIVLLDGIWRILNSALRIQYLN